LHNLLADMHHNTSITLHDAPYVCGIILSTGAMLNSADPRDETAWGDTAPVMLVASGPPRHVLATDPAAMLRALPGGRSRLTFVLRSPHPQLILPPGTELEPGLSYHDEESWLRRALTYLGQPSLNGLLRQRSHRMPIRYLNDDPWGDAGSDAERAVFVSSVSFSNYRA
jgi:hypothetical protein